MQNDENCAAIFAAFGRQKWTATGGDERYIDGSMCPCYNKKKMGGQKMPYSEAQNRANQKYKAKAYERIEVTVKKGMKEEYKALADKNGMSLNAYIISLLEREKEMK